MHRVCRVVYLGVCSGQHLPMQSYPQSLGRTRDCLRLLHKRQWPVPRKRGPGHLSRCCHLRPADEDAIPDPDTEAAKDCPDARIRHRGFRRHHGHGATQLLEKGAEFARSFM